MVPARVRAAPGEDRADAYQMAEVDLMTPVAGQSWSNVSAHPVEPATSKMYPDNRSRSPCPSLLSRQLTFGSRSMDHVSTLQSVNRTIVGLVPYLLELKVQLQDALQGG